MGVISQVLKWGLVFAGVYAFVMSFIADRPPSDGMLWVVYGVIAFYLAGEQS